MTSPVAVRVPTDVLVAVNAFKLVDPAHEMVPNDPVPPHDTLLNDPRPEDDTEPHDKVPRHVAEPNVAPLETDNVL